MNEKYDGNTIAKSYRKNNIRFDESGNIIVKNLSAYWIPELTVTEEINGTVYTVTGSYDGETNFTRKLERIMAKKYAEEMEITE